VILLFEHIFCIFMDGWALVTGRSGVGRAPAVLLLLLLRAAAASFKSKKMSLIEALLPAVGFARYG
jgi:hypothetical protein